MCALASKIVIWHNVMIFKQSLPLIKTQHDKALLHQAIVCALESNHQIALTAAQQAYETATNVETKAENKYDTFGLEASYLAHGQSKRVDESLKHIHIFKDLNVVKSNDVIEIGSLVLTCNEQEQPFYYFISPVAGGLKISFMNKEITLITPNAPLGKALMHQAVDEEIEFGEANKQHLNILTIY